MRTIQAPTAKLEFKQKYSMHVLPPCDQVGSKKGKNVTIEIVMVESGKQLPTKKSGKKTRLMYAQVDTISELLIQLIIGLNSD
jgi:hypothetical protein